VIFFVFLLVAMFLALVVQHFIPTLPIIGSRVLLMPIVMFYGALALPTPGERQFEGPQQPSVALEKVSPTEIQVGKPATFGGFTIKGDSNQPQSGQGIWGR